MMQCPECKSDVTLSGSVTCWCDKNYCAGQRCGADKLFRKYKCKNPDCGREGTPDLTNAYYERHSR